MWGDRRLSRIAISSTCLLDAYGMHAPQVTCLLKAAYDTGAGPSQGVEILNILYTDYVQYIYIYHNQRHVYLQGFHERNVDTFGSLHPPLATTGPWAGSVQLHSPQVPTTVKTA